jgi:CRP/FNR family transcriptional regulator, cyclic AMP receptor protein
METAVAVDFRSAGVKAMQAAAPRPRPSNTRFKTRLEEKQAFNAQAFLDSTGMGKKVVEYGSKEAVFTQGDPATSVLYIQKGGVKIAVVNESGKEAVLAILGPGAFFGERCLAGQPARESTATTFTPSTILVFEKQEMLRLLHTERALSVRFVKHLLSRNIRIEEELVDQLFNLAEKRLARTLLLLARCGKQDKPDTMVPGISQEVLAEMIGTTRSRVNCLMNKFRKLGYIEYGSSPQWLQINESLQRVLHD